MRYHRLTRPINYVAGVGERALKARGRDTLLPTYVPLSFPVASAPRFFLFPRIFVFPRETVNESSVIRSDIFNGESRRRCRQELEASRVPYKFAISQSLPAMYRYERICVREYTAQKLERKSGHVEIFS